MPIPASCLVYEQNKNGSVLCARWGHLGLALSLKCFISSCVCCLSPLYLQVSMAACFLQPCYNLKAIILQQYGQGDLSLSWATFSYAQFKVNLLLLFSAKPEVRHPCSHSWNISQFSSCLNLSYGSSDWKDICVFFTPIRVQHSNNVNDCHWYMWKKWYHNTLCLVPLSSHSTLLKCLFMTSVAKQKPVWNMLLSKVTLWSRNLEPENKRLVFL